MGNSEDIFIENCPNQECGYHQEAPAKWYHKNGYFTQQHSGEKIQKYRCKNCKKDFSANTGNPMYGQAKPELNDKVFELICSGLSERKIAEELEISKLTVERKIKWLGDFAKQKHLEFMSTHASKVESIYIEELQTYEHSKSNIVYISLVVDSATDFILEAVVTRESQSERLREKYQQMGTSARVNRHSDMLRKSFKRLAFKTTNGCKSIDSLQRVMFIYIAHNNEYNLG